MTLLPLAALRALLVPRAPAIAADPTGMWLTQDGDTARSGSPSAANAICGTIAWLEEPIDTKTGRPRIDRRNADASKRAARCSASHRAQHEAQHGPDERGPGEVYNAEDGKTYSGSFTLAGANKADLKGCVTIICKTKTWTRTN